MATYLTILCFLQLIIGPFMTVIGIVDRCIVKSPQSFLMLPIWNGLLVGIAGYAGLCVGRNNKREGNVNVNAVSGLRAVNTMCIGLSFLAFYMYGQILAAIGWRQEMEVISGKTPVSAVLQIPPDIKITVQTVQGIYSVIMVLSLLEMFIGGWLAMLEKDQMFFGSPPRPDRRPLVVNEASQLDTVQQPVQQP